MSKKLKIPTELIDKIKFYINLPQQVKNEVVEVLGRVPLGMSPNSVFEFAEKEIQSLSKEKIEDILQVYFSIAGVKARLNLSNDDFFNKLTTSIEELDDKDLYPVDESINNIKRLINSKGANNNLRIINTYSDNEKNYVESDFVSNIRPIYDEEKEFIGSTILTGLKISYSKNGDLKDFFVTLDIDDLENLQTKITSSIEEIKRIKKEFSNLKITELK